MSKSSKAGKAAGAAGGAYSAARSNEYVQRLIDDEDLRGNLRDAYESARTAYGRVSGTRKGAVKSVASDKKAQKELRRAADSLRDAGEQLRGQQKSGKGRFGKILLLGAVGGAVALALSEGARKTVMDTLFGAEEEFEYTSTTSGNSSSAASSPSSSGSSASGASSSSSGASSPGSSSSSS